MISDWRDIFVEGQSFCKRSDN